MCVAKVFTSEQLGLFEASTELVEATKCFSHKVWSRTPPSHHRREPSKAPASIQTARLGNFSLRISRQRKSIEPSSGPSVCSCSGNLLFVCPITSLPVHNHREPQPGTFRKARKSNTMNMRSAYYTLNLHLHAGTLYSEWVS